MKIMFQLKILSIIILLAAPLLSMDKPKPQYTPENIAFTITAKSILTANILAVMLNASSIENEAHNGPKTLHSKKLLAESAVILANPLYVSVTKDDQIRHVKALSLRLQQENDPKKPIAP